MVEDPHHSLIEFEYTDSVRFAMLATVFNALQIAKHSDSWPEEERWLAYFDDLALKHFWWPTEEEKRDWENRWFSTPVPQRSSDPALKTPWLFGAMIDAFQDGEYELKACRQLAENHGQLEFVPLAWPYGGTDFMVALIEAFGIQIVQVIE